MAISNDQRVMIYDNDSSDGHDVYCYIPVRDLVGLNSRPFTVDYNTNCPDLSTSWRLGIVYKQNPETGNVTCFVTLNRTDVKVGYVKVFVLVSYLDANGLVVHYPKLIGTGQILAGDKIQGSSEEARHPGYRSYIFSLGLFLRVSMFFRNCHSEARLHAKARFCTGEKKMYRSKM
ncbi:hypothetical protein HNY73_006929 [Argiope bruennichi]|uniref:Uncharacterized protein n=1 Tax=Argiope bruennichi TaxID=94029 RepID=A0A8T0FF34_ARGBR|nr:hypothetical protein HNY73_006929 [Argiope bruennichi]